MRRRRFITLIGLGTTAGCIDGGGSGGGVTDSPTGTETQPPTDTDSPTAAKSPTDTDSPTESPTPTPAPMTVTGKSLERTGDCASSDAGTASVRFESGAVVVEGCIEGSTGCSVAALKSVQYDANADQLAVTVETMKEGDVCTQQLVYRAYTARVQYDGSAPGSVEVRHADDDGGKVVTTADS